MEETKMNGDVTPANGQAQTETSSAPREGEGGEGGAAKSVISINKKNVTITSTAKDRSKVSKVTTTPLRSNQDPSLAGASHVSTRIKDTQFMATLSQKFQGNGSSTSVSPVPASSPRAIPSSSTTPSSRSSHSRSSSSSSTGGGGDLSSKLSSMLLQQQQQQQQQLQQQQQQQQQQQEASGTTSSATASEESQTTSNDNSSVPPSTPPVKLNGHPLGEHELEGCDSGSDASSSDLLPPPPPPPPSALIRSISEHPPLRKADASYTPRPKSYSTQTSGSTTPTGNPHHHHKNDLMAALTAVVTSGSPAASLRKTRGPGKAGGMTEVFVSKRNSGGSSTGANGTDKQTDPQPSSEDFEPKKFLDQVPEADSAGNTIPDWKRLMMAKTIAQKAQEEYLEKKKVEDYEARFKNMPDWKRALIEKKEAGTGGN